MGQPKQLVDVDGLSLVRRSALTALGARIGRVIAVVGAEADSVAGKLVGLDVTIARNDHWATGLSSSLRAGIAAAREHSANAVLFIAADQPFVTADALVEITQHWRQGGRIVASGYAGTVGLPVLFDAAFFGDIEALTGDRGAKGVILAHGSEVVRVPLIVAATDIDTPEDLARLRG
jgi:molybdenum cofactor cytidylyltransferase